MLEVMIVPQMKMHYRGEAYHKMEHKARDADEDISTWAIRNPFSLIF
jgi:hypothetical protein